ncbi:hypothetical protein [Acinetobacter phage vB_AbaS_TCUP2199]|nr:hypothetical protein [Acinetobacter phage vB_AbaS_TCUP2199]
MTIMSNTNTPIPKANDDTDLGDFFNSLAGGVQRQIIQKVMSSVAKGVLQHGSKGKTGEVHIKLKFARLSDDTVEQGAVKITSEVFFAAPTQRGKKNETESRESVMYMSSQGLTDAPPKKLDEEQHSQSGMPVPKTGTYAS